ncbi:MAG: Phosphoadenylyl-sulfate reductase [Alphaproteobacteria bacterium]|nr:Phosphoadenylyl-sulfate reductase [Alphaproteobacteria bacterium]
MASVSVDKQIGAEQVAAAGLSASFAVAAGPTERLRLLADRFEGAVLTTSFGIEDQLLTHFIFAERLPIEVVTLDTGRLFPSTYQLWQQTEERYGKRIRSFHPEQAGLAAFIADAGINGFYDSRAARTGCCFVRKVEPLGRALAGAPAWVVGLRADQSGQRSTLAPASWDEGHGLIKVAPLFDWTREQVASACESLAVPVNSLHAHGFLSIGCEPCTRAVRPGEPERSGRWWWESDEAKECGLHLDSNGRLVRAKAAA